MREKYIDIAKALGIIFVIIGHTCENPYLFTIIYSFHMPLFFMLSGMATREVTNRTVLQKKMFRNVKYIGVSFLLYIILSILRYHNSIAIGSVGLFFKAIMTNIVYTVLEEYEGIAGPNILWFLVVWAEARILYDLITYLFGNTKRLLVIIFITLLGVVMGRYFPLFFGIDIALASQIYIYIGTFIVQHGVLNKKRCFELSGLLYCVFLAIQYIVSPHAYVVYLRVYPAFPICALLAITGCVFVLCLSQKISMTKFLSGAFSFIGRYQFIFYSVHCFDVLWLNILFTFCKNSTSRVGVRILFDFMIAIGIICLKKIMLDKLRYVFENKES